LTLYFRLDWKGLLALLHHLVTKATAVISSTTVLPVRLAVEDSSYILHSRDVCVF